MGRRSRDRKSWRPAVRSEDFLCEKKGIHDPEPHQSGQGSGAREIHAERLPGRDPVHVPGGGPVKRVVDYPRIYDSAKLAALPNDEYRAEYVWLLGIAGPNGSFEWCERRLWAAAYAPMRDKTLEDLRRYLEAFLAAGLLVKGVQAGKTWW